VDSTPKKKETQAFVIMTVNYGTKNSEQLVIVSNHSGSLGHQRYLRVGLSRWPSIEPYWGIGAFRVAIGGGPLWVPATSPMIHA
jgi:hypothetical protein